MNIIKTALLTAALLCAVSFSACDGSDDPTEEQLFLKRLEGRWTLTTGSVKVDGRDVTNSFAGMEITFSSDKTYVVANPVSPIWPATGAFTLERVSSDLFNILRDDQILITVEALTSSTVTMSFHYTSPNGRTKEVSGEYVFVMNH
jgi:hypothetical protein